MKKILNWIVTSSADPRATSLAIKGSLVVIGGYIVHLATVVCGFGFYCIGIDTLWMNSFIEAVSNIIYFLTSLIGPVMTIVGLFRKINLGRWSAAPDPVA